jgi:saccharopine dehydrogenase-like NADP-dependent oxidoreductase
MAIQILIIGAGKSATVLINYLQQKAVENDWYVVLADADATIAANKWKNAANGHTIGIDIEDNEQRKALIKPATIVISMLPAALHFLVAKDCLALGKSLFTASYVDDNMKSIAQEIQNKNLLFVCEMGLDPGIDHMSAMELIDRIKEKNGQITGFKSHCGGLIAPESDTNPWHYKISWNPRNIILAGKAGAMYLEEGKKITIEYNSIFKNTPIIAIPSIGNLTYYPNRDSLAYMETYQLQNIPNFVRTTLRHAEFCKGWNAIVQLQLTSETVFDRVDSLTIMEWMDQHIEKNKLQTVLNSLCNDPVIENQLEYLGLDRDLIIPTQLNTNAGIMQWILEDKWKLASTDKDMVVMMHEINYTLNNKAYLVQSSMVLKGKNELETAMATTVGLPLAMAACAYLQGEINLSGLHIPTTPIIYTPILKRLAAAGIVFQESEIVL